MEELGMSKTPEYTKRAVKNYRDKFDFIQIRFPKGTRERLAEKGNINDYICGLVMADLGEQEESKAPGSGQKSTELQQDLEQSESSLFPEDKGESKTL